MSNDTVIVGCRLPSGITLEVGYTTVVTSAGGAPYARYTKGADYQAITLKGTNQHLLVREAGTRKILTVLPGKRDREPYINHGVPKDFWDRWCKEHAESPLLKTGQIFVIPKPADQAAVTKDAKAMGPAIFEPLSQTEKMKIDGVDLTRRADDEG
jgi:hypothetical protein